MAQRKGRRKAPAQPIGMTREELDAKARGSRKAEAVTRRIRREVPTKSLGQLKTKALAPARISPKEMRSIQRSGKPSSPITKRLARAAEADDSTRRASPRRRKAEPQKPISKGRKR